MAEEKVAQQQQEKTVSLLLLTKLKEHWNWLETVLHLPPQQQLPLPPESLASLMSKNLISISSCFLTSHTWHTLHLYTQRKEG